MTPEGPGEKSQLPLEAHGFNAITDILTLVSDFVKAIYRFSLRYVPQIWMTLPTLDLMPHKRFRGHDSKD